MDFGEIERHRILRVGILNIRHTFKRDRTITNLENYTICPKTPLPLANAAPFPYPLVLGRFSSATYNIVRMRLISAIETKNNEKFGK